MLAAPLALAAVALAAGPYTVQWNGKTVFGDAIMQGGKTYVSAEALKNAGIGVSVRGNVVSLAPVGGANEVGAVEGCLNQQLFNGVWRFKVLSVVQSGPLWRLKVEMKFGSATGGYSTSGTGVLGYNLQLESGKVIPVNSSVVDLRDKGFLPGEGFTPTLDFDAGGVGGKPVKLVVPVDPAGVANTGLSYSVKDPSFRVDLTCKK
ncbi:hypothetical protein BOO71_0009052 [Deinococcus marmoris]|uniref:DUF4352 domain-containing protein n=1 Tax=Deinococcus marmoris TaxID=249408 RepID=A0A1U7NWR9_9DEIO|nr:hypothetical protein BOO71_0009052 [Deinococcus marmoris]